MLETIFNASTIVNYSLTIGAICFTGCLLNKQLKVDEKKYKVVCENEE